MRGCHPHEGSRVCPGAIAYGKLIVCRSSQHPIRYAILLTALLDGKWQTIRTFANAHEVEEHHEHRYAGDEKQAPVTTTGPVNEAMAMAEAAILANWPSMVDDWKQTQ